MIHEDKNAATFVGQLYDVRTKRDGGGRLTVDFGADSLEAIQFLQKLSATKDCNFTFAVVLLPQGVVDSSHEEDGIF